MADHRLLLPDETQLGMPFLREEELPFVKCFDAPDEITVEEAIYLMESLNNTNPSLAAIAAASSPTSSTAATTTNNNNATTTPSVAAPGSAPPRGAGQTAFKKSCTICATRKIKCEIVAGSDPKVCKHCQQKGFSCTFEMKKVYKT